MSQEDISRFEGEEESLLKYFKFDPGTTGYQKLRHPSSEKFHSLVKEAGETHDRKQADYGTDDDPFANVRAAAAFGVEAWIGCMIRANDKMVRIQTAAQKGAEELKNESLRDSLMDLAVYSLIAIVLLEENGENEKV